MFGSEVLDVGVGMALLFLFMSVIATSLCELVENAFKARAKFLEQGLMELFDSRRNPELLDSFYKHPLISSLYQGNYISGSRTLPSYIPKKNFSLAVLDILAAQGGQNALSIASLKTALAGMSQPNPVQRMLLAAVEAAGDDLQKARTELEDWFDATMERVSGWYKRLAGYRLMVIGLLAAIAFNVDAIEVGRSLATEKGLREAIVQEAERVSQGAQPESSGTIEGVSKVKAEMTAAGFPIGWAHGYPKSRCTSIESGERTCDNWAIAVLPAIPGWLITTLAIMLGAPFWFDVLKQMMVIRSTVKPKDESVK